MVEQSEDTKKLNALRTLAADVGTSALKEFLSRRAMFAFP